MNRIVPTVCRCLSLASCTPGYREIQSHTSNFEAVHVDTLMWGSRIINKKHVACIWIWLNAQRKLKKSGRKFCPLANLAVAALQTHPALCWQMVAEEVDATLGACEISVCEWFPLKLLLQIWPDLTTEGVKNDHESLSCTSLWSLSTVFEDRIS